MSRNIINARDAQFVLFEQLNVDKYLPPELQADSDIETLKMIINEAEKVAVNALAPTNKDGDKQGCRFEKGSVFVPASFFDGYQVIKEGGWNIISDSPDVGGQGLPTSVGLCCREFFSTGNMSLTNYINLTHGVGKLIEIFGTPEQKDIFLDKLYGLTWGGTMCLTEPDAGSDVGAIKTTAGRKEDGTYSIKGTKIFISGGEHNMAENIIHMVLARIEGDPPGTKGLSLFIVPKFRVSNGEVGEPNDVACTGIEEKMGLHGSSTCTLNFGDDGQCIGYLIGQEQQGIMVMFHMMNEARQGVGIQGIAMASAAYLEAAAYAKERLQGVHFTQVKDPDAPKVPIIEHPDIRLSLMRMKAYVEGCRAMVYYHAHCMDRAEFASSAEDKARWNGLMELLTPVCKAYCTDRGFQVCSDGVQVLGGYGYCSEFPIEQYLRDVRITPIYEGTNAIQALDLLTRKIVMKKGKLFQDFLGEMDAVMARAGEQESLSKYVSLVKASKATLIEGTNALLKEMSSGESTGIALAKASKYLEFFGDIVLAVMWLWQMTVAQEKLSILLNQREMKKADFNIKSPKDSEPAFYSGKIQTGQFYLERIMPALTGKLEELKSRGDNFLEMGMECF